MQITINNGHYKYKDVDAVDIVMLIYLLFIFYTVHENRMYNFIFFSVNVSMIMVI
jgi:hypothetical protein